VAGPGGPACEFVPPVCGDGVVNQPSEQCDGADVTPFCDDGGEGTLACRPDCTCCTTWLACDSYPCCEPTDTCNPSPGLTQCTPCAQRGQSCGYFYDGLIVHPCCDGLTCFGELVDPSTYVGTCDCVGEGESCYPGIIECCAADGLTCDADGSGTCVTTG
jgi:hypothetical protein